MKKLIWMTFVLLISLNVLAQKYELNYRGTFSSSIINGYVGDAAFWNDTCYFISGDGSRLFTTTLDGSLVGNYFSGKTFNTASQLYVNQDYVIVLEQGKIVFYTKQGQFVRQISVPNTRYHYFWIKNNQEIMCPSAALLPYDTTWSLPDDRMYLLPSFQIRFFFKYSKKQ